MSFLQRLSSFQVAEQLAGDASVAVFRTARSGRDFGRGIARRRSTSRAGNHCNVLPFR